MPSRIGANVAGKVIRIASGKSSGRERITTSLLQKVAYISSQRDRRLFAGQFAHIPDSIVMVGRASRVIILERFPTDG